MPELEEFVVSRLDRSGAGLAYFRSGLGHNRSGRIHHARDRDLRSLRW
jgi:hypothetical protein